VPEKNNI